LQYRHTESAPRKHLHAARVADELNQRERALRRLPLPYSVALRLRDAGISADTALVPYDLLLGADNVLFGALGTAVNFADLFS
jgi:3-mercaptopyruvate sulfurtransferase SseA